jgi:hypothetical protein
MDYALTTDTKPGGQQGPLGVGLSCGRRRSPIVLLSGWRGFHQGKGSVASEVLASGDADEALYTAMGGSDIMGLFKVRRGLLQAHNSEEVSGGHEDAKVQLGLGGAVRQVEGVESGAISTDVDKRSLIGWFSHSRGGGFGRGVRWPAVIGLAKR